MPTKSKTKYLLSITFCIFVLGDAGQHLQCQKYWCGHYENLAIGGVSSGVQRWINEGPGGGHHDNMVSRDVAWIGCWHKGGCLKCLYWGI